MNSAVVKCLWSTKSAVEGIGKVPQNEDGTIQGEESDESVTKVPGGFMDIVALTGLGSALTTLVLTEGHVVTTACLTTAILSPLAAYQKRKLRHLGGLRGQQNQLRHNVNAVWNENNILTASVHQLSTQVDKLEGVESELEEIAKAAETNVNRLVDIVHENGEIQAKIKQRLEQQVISTVLSVVVQVDTNRDFTLGPQELELLTLRLQQVQGIDFDQVNFKKACRNDADGIVTLTDIMNILRNLLDDDVPEQDNIFHLKPKAILLQNAPKKKPAK